MKAKTITAKLRDAVPVCFMVNGDEMTRYRNIDIPESLKDLEIRDFGFQVLADGKIEFNLHFEQGILPTEFPAARAKVTRAARAAAKAMATEAIKDAPATEAAEVPDIESDAPQIIGIDATPSQGISEPVARGLIEAPKDIKATIPETFVDEADALVKKPARRARTCKSA